MNFFIKKEPTIKTKFLKVFIPTLLLFLPGCINHKDTNLKNKTLNNTEGPIDLVPTKEESAATEKWKAKSFDDLVKDAASGDSAGLYMVGLCYLFGNKDLGISIDVETANHFFALSASLGFAPALDKIRSMYIDDHPNPWLTMVYLNLTTSSGHPEFVFVYHKMRSQAVEQFGEDFGKEFEKIAAHKLEVIAKNKKNLEEAVDKKHFLLTKMINITKEDSNFDNNYWCRIFQKNKKN